MIADRALVIARSWRSRRLGRRRWKKTSGYHGQARVENAFFRYTSIIGDGLRASSDSCNNASLKGASLRLSGKTSQTTNVPKLMCGAR